MVSRSRYGFRDGGLFGGGIRKRGRKPDFQGLGGKHQWFGEFLPLRFYLCVHGRTCQLAAPAFLLGTFFFGHVSELRSPE